MQSACLKGARIRHTGLECLAEEPRPLAIFSRTPPWRNPFALSEKLLSCYRSRQPGGVICLAAKGYMSGGDDGRHHMDDQRTRIR